jgi:hypothetical protein
LSATGRAHVRISLDHLSEGKITRQKDAEKSKKYSRRNWMRRGALLILEREGKKKNHHSIYAPFG